MSIRPFFKRDLINASVDEALSLDLVGKHVERKGMFDKLGIRVLFTVFPSLNPGDFLVQFVI